MAGILVLCVMLVGFWQFMSRQSGEAGSPFVLSAGSFTGFSLDLDAWITEPLPVGNDPLQPNILVFRLKPRDDGTAKWRDSGPVLVRLVHGYNMVDCMRIKGYEVQEVLGRGGPWSLVLGGRQEGDEGHSTKSLITPPDQERPRPGTTNLPDQGPRTSFASPAKDLPDQGRRTSPTKDLSPQLWRVTSSTGDVTIWVTSMLRAHDFAMTDIDTRSMAFPRVGTPDDPNWVPRGLTLSSLKHPVSGLSAFLRSKWNASRCDPLVFLGLKTPPWASDELLTLVSASASPLRNQDEQTVIEHILSAHTAMHRAISQWR